MSCPPVPQSMIAATAATAPMAPKTRCPVISITIIVANMQDGDHLVTHQTASPAQSR